MKMTAFSTLFVVAAALAVVQEIICSPGHFLRRRVREYPAGQE
jgi:hypothetical protein